MFFFVCLNISSPLRLLGYVIICRCYMMINFLCKLFYTHYGREGFVRDAGAKIKFIQSTLELENV